MFTFSSFRAPATNDLQCSLDAQRILRDCCEQTSACRFQLVHCEYSVHATFAGIHEEWIQVEVNNEDSDDAIHPHAICCISFSYGTSYCAFLGCLIDVQLIGPGEYRVAATMPRQLTVTNLRQSFRVPVIENSGLEISVRNLKGESFHVVARDITEAGIEIAFEPGDAPGCSVGTLLFVELKFRGETVERTAEVRRVMSNRCGLSFSDPSDDDGHRRASCMRGIVLSLQQLWLRSRLL